MPLLIKSQIQTEGKSPENEQVLKKERKLITLFHVQGLNNEVAKANIIKSINTCPDKITSWQFDLDAGTVRIYYYSTEREVDILELIKSAGYNSHYFNDKGNKIILEAVGKTREIFIKKQ